ncbi:MAG: PocR ligand-binding domain-containing protein [Oscillospiraceae bacterium]|nr:PocR ligand-binding domain-containing protein [Oscillospiraceae bacterium]MDD4546452.1 PocR ligand-binding domain-containing protein [Oscillospiraceae bacterium]
MELMMINDDRLELQSILRELHNISGFRLSIHDMKYREIVSYPQEKSAFCRLIQQNQVGSNKCKENDRKAFERVSKNPEVYLYKCCFGLYEAVAPLYILGNVVGYLMMGQTIDTSDTSRENIINSTSHLVSNKEELIQAANQVFICEQDKILSCMKIMDICSKYISLSNRFHLNKTDLSDKIKEYLDENYSRNITIESICLKFFCSRTSIMTAFKANFGVGIIEYLTYIRIQTAKLLLSGTSKSVKEIAESCGYPDQNYFSKVFSKRCGMTPTKYRKNKTSKGRTSRDGVITIEPDTL